MKYKIKEIKIKENLKIACLCPFIRVRVPALTLTTINNLGFTCSHQNIRKAYSRAALCFIEPHIHSCQSRFRQKLSTSTFLQETTNNLFLSIDKGEYNIAVFLDLQKAFDTVNHEVMLYKLFLYAVRSIEFEWFSSHLESRQQFCAYQNIKLISEWAPVVYLTDHVLALLFLIYVNDLPFLVKITNLGCMLMIQV